MKAVENNAVSMTTQLERCGNCFRELPDSENMVRCQHTTDSQAGDVDRCQNRDCDRCMGKCSACEKRMCSDHLVESDWGGSLSRKYPTCMDCHVEMLAEKEGL